MELTLSENGAKYLRSATRFNLISQSLRFFFKGRVACCGGIRCTRREQNHLHFWAVDAFILRYLNCPSTESREKTFLFIEGACGWRDGLHFRPRSAIIKIYQDGGPQLLVVPVSSPASNKMVACLSGKLVGLNYFSCTKKSWQRVWRIILNKKRKFWWHNYPLPSFSSSFHFFFFWQKMTDSTFLSLYFISNLIDGWMVHVDDKRDFN